MNSWKYIQFSYCIIEVAALQCMLLTSVIMWSVIENSINKSE